MSTVPALELLGVKAAYGRIQVLHGVDLVVPPGCVFALLGVNGAGKTTTIKVIDGRVGATAGCVHVAGRHVNGVSSDVLARAGVCSIPEGRGIFPNLTVAENIRMTTYSARRPVLDELEEKTYARFPILGERRTQLAGTMSGGQQQMLALGRALVSEPAVLLIDELSMGLAPIIVAELYEAVAGLATEGLAILIVEQFARTALAIADYGAVMAGGRITTVGEPDDLHDVLEAAYLGHAS